KISVSAKDDSKQPILPEQNDDFNYLAESVQEMSEKLLLLAEDTADEISIRVLYGKEEKIVRLPLRAMFKHLVETTVSAPFETKLGPVLKEVKRISFIVTDRAKLALFNVFNLQKEDTDSRRTEEVKAALLSINEESETLNQIAASITKEITEHTNRL